MIKSMTGFGKASILCDNRKISIEIKSLNSKQLDISTKIPSGYKSKDIEIRNLIKEHLERGKVDIFVSFDNMADTEKEAVVNTAAVEQYFIQLCAVAKHLGVKADENRLLQTALRFPDVLNGKNDALSEEDWLRLKKGIAAALAEINKFREQEGEILMNDILHRIDLICKYAAHVFTFEQERIPAVRLRLQERLNEWAEGAADKNRLEQELIYYLEKLDITEEKVRLDNHCRYFLETARTEPAPGRKLGFIAQEIGREINTMGSKANEHNIQKLVVQMKDELEKIKEQCLNIL